MKELIIIGGGPAGLTASIYSARKKIDFVLVTKDIGGQALWGSEIENYLGYHMVSGVELVRKFDEHVNKFGIGKEFIKIEKVLRENDNFTCQTESGKAIQSKTVILAAGKIPRLLNVPGERKFHGRGVTYCATCDAPLFAGMPTLVVGGGNSGLEAAIQLTRISPKVYIVTEKEITGDPVTFEKIKNSGVAEIFTNTKVNEIKGEMFVDTVSIQTPEGERQLKVNGVFIEIGALPNTSMVKELTDLNQKMEVKVNCRNETSVQGLFAAGDVTNVPEKQIIVAAGEGAKAALSAYDFLCRHW